MPIQAFDQEPRRQMRRKVIQHFANMLPQRFLDLPDGFDLGILAGKRNGRVIFDFLQGSASIDGIAHPQMRTGTLYREWLLKEAAAHRIPADALLYASMEVEFDVAGIRITESYGHVFRSATFHFGCASELRTDEKSYTGRSSGVKAWGYGYYWDKLFGAADRGA